MRILVICTRLNGSIRMRMLVIRPGRRKRLLAGRDRGNSWNLRLRSTLIVDRDIVALLAILGESADQRCVRIGRRWSAWW